MITLIPSRHVADPDILLSSVILDCVGSLHGDTVTIKNAPMDGEIPTLSSLEVELSNCFNYPPLPLDQLSKLGKTALLVVHRRIYILALHDDASIP